MVRIISKTSQDPDAATLARQASALIAGDSLPKSYPVGAHKAYEKMQEFYGPDEGRRIFIKKALETGRGDTVREKVADVYKTGARPDNTRKLDTRVSVSGSTVSVAVSRPQTPPRVQIISR